jgi:hypothetical protein
MSQDQTDPLWLRGTSEYTNGTGVYLGAGFRLRFDQGITYERSRADAEATDAIAFKWVPDTLASYFQVQNSKCQTSGERCVDRCPGYSCFCLNGRCAP